MRLRKASGILGDRRLIRLAVLHSVSMGLSVITANWVVPLLVRRSFTPVRAGLVGSLVLVGGFIGRPTAGWMEARRSRWTHPLLVACLGTGCLSTATLALTSTPGMAIVAAGFLGLAAGVPFATIFTTSPRVRPEAPAAAIAFVNMCGNLTAVVGTPLLGAAFSLPDGARWSFLGIALLWAVPLLTLRKADPVAGRDAVFLPRSEAQAIDRGDRATAPRLPSAPE